MFMRAKIFARRCLAKNRWCVTREVLLQSLPKQSFSEANASKKHVPDDGRSDLSHTREAPPSNARENEDVWDTSVLQRG